MVKIKFTHAGAKRDIIELEGEKHLTLSNRQLSVQYLNPSSPIDYKLGWSIDRITLVGDIKITRNNDGTITDLTSVMNTLLLAGKGAVEKLPKGWQLKNRQGEQVAYVEYLEFDDTRGRIDFNPNTLSEIIQINLKDFINLVFDNVKFSRIDVACDIINVPDVFIEQYNIIKDVKSTVIRSRGGAMETTYWGSPSSGKQVRLYNKKKERTKKHVKIQDGIDSWWRFEAQLRGQTTQEWFSAVDGLLNYFTSPYFIPLDITGTEKVMLRALLEHPESFKELSKATRSKYKKLVSRVVENDELTIAMIEQFSNDMKDLEKELQSWLKCIDVTENDEQ